LNFFEKCKAFKNEEYVGILQQPVSRIEAVRQNIGDLTIETYNNVSN
jgi:hypothetical protein